MGFKIGDKVKYTYDGVKYEIIADKDTPYKHTMLGEIFPNPGCDFVLRKLEIPHGEFAPFLHAHADLLKPI